MAYEPILTNLTLTRMDEQHITKAEVLAAFHSKNIESIAIPGAIQGITHRGKYVIGVIYKKNQRGQYIIITAWKRKRF